MREWELLELPDGLNEEELVEHCWSYFERTFIRDAEGDPVEVLDWRGCRVIFSRFAFNHIISGSSDYRLGLGFHDIGFVRERAICLPWIGLALSGEGDIEVRHQERKDSRGRRLKRRVLVVVRQRYVVVLDREDDGSLRLRTAFPADADYVRKIRNEGALIEVRREKEKPQS